MNKISFTVASNQEFKCLSTILEDNIASPEAAADIYKQICEEICEENSIKGISLLLESEDFFDGAEYDLITGNLINLSVMKKYCPFLWNRMDVQQAIGKFQKLIPELIVV